MSGTEHVRSGKLAHDERGGNTPVEGVPEIFVRDVEKPGVGGATDVVDENVDAAEALHRGVDDTLTVGTAYRIRNERQPLAAGLLDALD